MRPQARNERASAAAPREGRLLPGPLWRPVSETGGRLLLRPAGARGEPLDLPSSFASVWRDGAAPWPLEEPDQGAAVAALCDGALALDSPDGPLSGPAALLALGLAMPVAPEPTPVMALSLAALRHASLAPRSQPYPLTASLYFAGRRPCGPAALRRLPDAEAVGRFLGIARIAARPAVAEWFGPPRLSGEWLFWRAPQPGTAEKLYIAPELPALCERLPALAQALAEAGASGFKLPASARGLHRPDRCIAYFPDAAARRRAEAALRPLLAGAPAEPAPFTVSCGEESLLSWGRDPAPGGEAWRQGRSWRLWLCGLLARALAAAAALPHPELPAWRFALLRAGLAGLDPTSFAPGGVAHAA